ncbi:nickel/cobalt ABC transporter permease [Citrobacter sp. JGM124]|uniref:nickel/cobalt ABC transporter permease n=1 Tax=Citrobacter sp. JGM124 TaxID=2799789 RepID=UPI001BAD0C80|nr:nickel/cobalt ABC transporter permease [Citrobacter sp. JGM124]MBS0848146.1 ABC transporter permease subunit [Citrobacter sp. JGM124]
MISIFIQQLRRDGFAQICFAIVIIVIVAGILAPWLAPHDPIETSIRMKYQGSSFSYPLGTDNLGRCILSRLLFGIRTTVFYALLAMALTLLFGCLIGMIAGVFGGKTDEFLMRLCDVMLSFPGEVMILALVGVLGPGIENILLAIVLVKWSWYARMIRGTVIQYTHRNYVRYAQVIGASPGHILKKHILPMTMAEITILATSDIGSVILMISALSFLGLGVQAPTPEWGNMLSEAKNVMIFHPELMLPAGLAIVIVVAAFNGLGDFLRDIADPANRYSHISCQENKTDD